MRKICNEQNVTQRDVNFGHSKVIELASTDSNSDNFAK